MNIPEGYYQILSEKPRKGDIRVRPRGEIDEIDFNATFTAKALSNGILGIFCRKLPTKKPVRATSRASWKLIKDSELLPKSHKLIIAYLCTRKQPVTSGEIEAYLQNSSAHKRLSELRNAGYIEECEKRKCSVTGVEALTWKVSIV